jgi:hypothetical protein
MSATSHKLRVVEARRVKHPTYSQIEKHTFTVRAKDMPSGIRTDANARDATGLNRRVYREVNESLFNRFAFPGIFDLMNKGITILADKVRRIDDHTYELDLVDGQGIVDGGHTYKIICDAQDDPNLPDDQHVDVHVRTGVDEEMISEIARGLNTGMQVKQHSLDDLADKFEWVKEELQGEAYFKSIAWRESDKGDYDVRDLIAVMEALNVIDFPNDSGTHPIQAYEKWSVPAEKFSKDADEFKKAPEKSKYYRLRPILKEALTLFDLVRHDFYEVYNGKKYGGEKLGSGGKLDIVEQAREGKKFAFPFARLSASEYRLTKGATYPIFAAFRNLVELNPETGMVRWRNGFKDVIELWESVSPEICRATKDSIREDGSKPDQLGKSRRHWSSMHKTVELFILRKALRDRT